MLKVLNRTIFLGIRRRETHSAGGRTGTESSETKKKNRKTEQRTAIADYRTDKTEQGTEKQGQLRPECPEEKETGAGQHTKKAGRCRAAGFYHRIKIDLYKFYRKAP